MLRCLQIGVLILCCLCVGVNAATPATLPSGDDLHKQFEAKQYQSLLMNLARVLQLKGAAAQPYDRVDLLMLRGEALTQLKQQAAAVEAFDAAAKEATSAQTKVARTPEQVALARAMSMLVHQSHNFAYTPRAVAPGQRPDPISLLDLSQRPAAFKALLSDALAEMGPKVKVAAQSATLAPILTVVRNLGDLRALELTATKATKQSDELLTQMADKAYGLMDAEMNRIDPLVQGIDKNAHSRIPHVYSRPIGRDRQTGLVYSETYTTYTFRGLYSNDMRDLKTFAATCELVYDASHDFSAATTDKRAAKFDKLAAQAKKTGDEALQTLNDNYTGEATAR